MAPPKLGVIGDASGNNLRGLGFRCPGTAEAMQAGTEAGQGYDGKELLRKSGKSVGEYFAEKMRLKCAGKAP
jgi:hypothetical protein